MIEFDEGLATLVAAILAAIMSLLTYFSTKPTEIRAANRKTLEPYIYDIADSIHQLIATSNIFLKNKTQESRDNWKEKGEAAKLKLKEIRPKIRYSLWGLEDYILSLTRLPDYTLYTIENIEVAKKVVKRGTRLGDRIDKCIKNCYLKGRAPYQTELFFIKIFNWHYKQTRDNYKKERKVQP